MADLATSIILAQEAAGQRDVAMGGKLPINGTSSLAQRQQYEALGFVFGEQIDDLFIAVTFPAGWSVKATDHSMHSVLMDDKGRERGGIFYKAAFYDRSAHISLFHRFSAGARPVGGWESGDDSRYEGYVRADGEDRYVTPPTSAYPGRADNARVREWYREQDSRRELAHAWLVSRFPAHEDPLAYWD